MTSIESIILEVPDPAAAEHFYAAAFGLGDRLRRAPRRRPDQRLPRVHGVPRGRPAEHVDSLIGTAVHARRDDAQARQEELLGLRRRGAAPDGAIWKIATSAKKNTGPATREVDDVVLLLGVAMSRRANSSTSTAAWPSRESFGSKYVEFDAADSPVKLALYGRRAAAKDAGVPADGTGAHRIVIIGAGGPFTDPDGFAWETGT